ncbi:Hypothetical protein SMAX5B_012716 [Scophthalmus maximus]|uniref:Uncharacterized protein n=1 Tax=Scophthalmus maximus TaxID=52904 RepID=A0A2U9BCU8_SCOMX|nr:Hypothetical protein SMAX5B_012716 [Scophthalmus maximus]
MNVFLQLFIGNLQPSTATGCAVLRRLARSKEQVAAAHSTMEVRLNRILEERWRG